MDRAYTVNEIDALRKMIILRESRGSCAIDPICIIWPDQRNGGPFLALVEDRLRTYMLAGITADDLIAADKTKEAGTKP